MQTRRITRLILTVAAIALVAAKTAQAARGSGYYVTDRNQCVPPNTLVENDDGTLWCEEPSAQR